MSPCVIQPKRSVRSANPGRFPLRARFVSSVEVFGATKLDDAMQELKVGGTMQYLRALNGVAF